MVNMLRYVVLALALVSASVQALDEEATPQKVNFEGDEVLRVIPRTHKQVRFMSKLEERITELDFWKQPYNIDHDVDFRVPKPLLNKVKRLLEKHGISYEILVEDVQRAIERESQSIIEHDRRKRSITDYPSEQEYLRDENERFLNSYNSHAQINNWLSKMADICGQRCSIHDIGVTGEGRVLRVIKIGGERKRNKVKNAVWIDAGIHGREWISPATAINIIYKFIMDFPKERCTRHLAEAYDWYILPVANPDGYEYSRSRNRMWRKNRRVVRDTERPWWAIYYQFDMSDRYCYGVDLNRNFGFRWGKVGTSTSPCSDIYGGTESFSEPETMAIQNFTKTLNNRGEIKIYLSLHAYGQYWLYSWGYTRQLPDDYQNLDSVATEAAHAIFKASHKKTQYIVGAAARTLYASSGASDDWAKGELGVKYAYTVELPPSDANAQGNGFLLPVSAIPGVVEDTWPGIRAMAAGETSLTATPSIDFVTHELIPRGVHEHMLNS